MLPASSRDLIRFIPREFSTEARAEAEQRGGDLSRFETPPVYLIGVPTVMGRAAWRRDVAAAGARYWTDELMLEALRYGIRLVVEAEQQPELLAIVDRYEEEKAAASEGASGATPNGDLVEIERAIRTHYPRYAEMEADRVFWLTVAPIKAAQHFLRGWENLATRFERKAGLVSEAALGGLPETHVMEIGFKAMNLMVPGKDQEKNFASPSPSG